MNIPKETAKQLAFRNALEDALENHYEELEAEELLAISSFFVGQLAAVQHKNIFSSPDEVMAFTYKKINDGIKYVINKFPDEFLESKQSVH